MDKVDNVSFVIAVFGCWECLGRKVGKSKLGPLIMGFFLIQHPFMAKFDSIIFLKAVFNCGECLGRR